MAANASSKGAKTVNGPLPFKFSLRPDLERVSFNLVNFPASLSLSITFPNAIAVSYTHLTLPTKA